MQVIEFFTTSNQAHWLEEIKKCDWGAGQYLYRLLRDGKLKQTVGRTALVPMLIEEETQKLVSFCTYAPLDDIQPTELTPWVGFVYTFPEYRGHRYFGQLLHQVESLATVMEKEYLYISTGHTGLYEKYGYEFYRMMKDIEGEDSRVYRKALQTGGADQKTRMELGGAWKEEIVTAAREGVDMAAPCGFSCAHCFLGQWCGGCCSVFSCCSYGTLFPGSHCPNFQCCEEKGLEGCYHCPELEDCTKGFYQDGQQGGQACKAQAIFLRNHGKQAFFQVRQALYERQQVDDSQQFLAHTLNEELGNL